MKFFSFSTLIVSLCLPAAFAQDFSKILGEVSKQAERNAKVSGLRFNCDPSDCKVRPLETLAIQVLVDGDFTSKEGQSMKGRLHRSPGFVMTVVEKDGGWVSKPFRFQGKDPGGFVSSGGVLQGILTKATEDYLTFDAFLYNAPETPGTYTLENETGGVKGQVKVIVDANAPSRRPAETTTFPAEDHSAEPYRQLVEHYAPVFAQETWWTPKADYPTRFDYDNDFLGENNWDNLDQGSSQAYIHYAVMETSSHWFLIYNAFHPRDYSDKCMIGSCHENDNEGLILTVRKDGSQFGTLQLMQTLAHDNVYNYSNDNSLRKGIHTVEGKIEISDGSHPVVFVESGGHGIYGTASSNQNRYDVAKDTFGTGTGVTFVYKGTAERPKHANDRKVGYDLLPILKHWWTRTGSDQNQTMFDEYGPYEPFGNRPRPAYPRFGHTFYGRKQASNKAKPFWGWHDNKTLNAKALSPGQWGLDPAYAVTRMIAFPANSPVSLDYTYNPYLGIGSAEAATTPTANIGTAPVVITAQTPAVGAPVATPVATPLATPAASVAGDSGSVEIQASVDGSVVFHIWQDMVTPEVLAGQPVKDRRVQFSGSVATGLGYVYSVQKKSGRGDVKIVEQPTDANGQTLKVRVDDPKGGADQYVFVVSWKRQ